MKVAGAARLVAPLFLVAVVTLRTQGPPPAAPATGADPRFDRVADVVMQCLDRGAQHHIAESLLTTIRRTQGPPS